MATELLFQRKEIKFILREDQADALMRAFRTEMQPDKKHRYTIENIYYDTDTYDLIRASLEKPVFKQKLRLRSYGIPQNKDTVFLEIKKKFRGIVYKRRVGMSLEKAKLYTEFGVKPTVSGAGFDEIDWLYTNKGLKAKLFIAYDRTAYVMRNLRVTFDRNVRSRTRALCLEYGDDGEPFGDDGCVIMEVKCLGGLPLEFIRQLEALKIYPSSFSKYGSIYLRMLSGNALRVGQANTEIYGREAGLRPQIAGCALS